MIDRMLGNSTIPVLEQMVGFAQARHEVLAGNLANMDTPGYRTRDLSVEGFQRQLREAIKARDRQPAGQSVSTTGASRGGPVEEVADGRAHILFHDDSNVGIEQQVAEISKNQMQHNLALSVMNNQFRLLHAAISERL